LGDKILRLIQENWTPGKVRRIIDEEPSPQFYSRAFGEYDARIEEGMNTTTQKQMHFMQLLKLQEIGLPVPVETIIEASTLQEKQKLTDAIQAQQQQQQQQAQEQQQVQMEVLKAQIQDLQARATANEGLGMERASRIEENRALAVERIAAAQKDRDLGTLDTVKAAKELTDIDLRQLQQAIDIIRSLQESAQVESQQKAEETLQGAQIQQTQ